MKSKSAKKTDASVLGQIMSAQNVLFVLPERKNIAEFYASSLSSIPGVSACRVCFGNASSQAGACRFLECGNCEISQQPAGEDVLLSKSHHCPLQAQSSTCVIALDTLDHRFGFFVFNIEHSGLFELYQPFISNLGNFIALSLENRMQKRSLQKAHDVLEERVKERTGELQSANDSLEKEIEERRQIEKHLRKEQERGNILLQLYEKASQLTEKELYDFALDQAVSLTESTIGFFHKISGDQKDIILTTWNREALKHCTAQFNTHYPIEEAGNWVDSVRMGHPVIYNDFPHSPNRKGLPEGHTQVRRFMSIPVFEEGHARIIFGVGNKSEEYDDQDIVHLQLVADELQRIINQRRSEKALQESEEQFKFLFDTMAQGVIVQDAESKIIDANKAAGEILGLTQDQLLGITTNDPRWKLIHEDGSPLNPEEMPSNIALRTGELVKEVFMGVYLPDQNTYHWILTSSTPKFKEGSKKPFLTMTTFTDITKRKRALEALRSSEEKFSKAFLSSPNLMAITTPKEGRIVEINDSYCRALGYNREECINFTTAELKIWADADQRNRIIRKIEEEGGVRNEEATLRKKTGDHISVVISMEPVIINDDELLLSVATDITDRKKAEELQHRLNRELRAISECNQTLMRAIDEQTLLHDICRIICDQAGYRMAWVGYAEQDHNKSIRPAAWAGFDNGYIADARLSWSEENERGRGPAGAAFRTGKTILVQDISSDPIMEPWRQSALQHSYHSGIVMPLKDEHASAFGVLLIYSDEFNAFTPDEIRLLEELAGDLAFGITTLRNRVERKRVEESLRSSESRFSSSFHLSPVAMAIFRAADGRFVDVNEVFIRSCGYSREEIIGHTTDELHLYADAEDRNAILKILQEQGLIENYEFRTRKKSGEIGIGLNSTTAIDIAGEKHFLSLILDITQRKRAEEELREAEAKRFELERELIQSQKFESLGTLASGIAHDFNNILGIILGYSTLGQRALGQQDQLLKCFNTITKATERGASLVKQLLTFARKTETQFQPMDINAFINEMIVLMAETFPKTISVSTQLSPRLPTITADATQLHQVVMNLCVNARDAMPRGGSLTLKTTVVPSASLIAKFPTAATAPYVEITVSDSGIGMDDRTRQQIFDPFFSTKEPGKGTGLGLALVYSIIRNHHGMIDVESKIGIGTTFHLYFPAEESMVDSNEFNNANSTDAPGGNETVLLIEDEEMLFDMVQTILVKKGYTVLHAKDGNEGVQLFITHQHEIAVVLTDLGLPVLRGDDVVRQIKAINPQTRIILASGFIEPEIKNEMTLLGVERFIQKPYTYADVTRSIRSVIDS